MKFVFPIQTSNGKEFANAKEFEKILKQETIGQYGFNPSHSTFHGGVHFTKKNAPWVRNQYPIRAIADGKIVACRLNYDYPETTYDGRTLPFSNDFCLIEHKFDYKDESDQNKTFIFYSLYMHLAALGDKKSEVEEEPVQHVLAQSWFGRVQPKIENADNTFIKLKKGTVLILDEETEPREFDNGSQTLTFRKYTVKDNCGLVKSLSMVGTNLWLADDPTPSEQNPQFIVKGGPIENAPEPTWFYQKLTAEVIADDYINVRSDPSTNGEAGEIIGLAMTGCTLTLERKRALKFYTINGQKYLMAKCEFKNDKAFKNDAANSPITLGWIAITNDNIKITGKTDALDFNNDANPVTETSISIRAGEPIGYLGRFDVLENDSEKGYAVTTRYQLHHELMSLEKPPQAFLQAYYGDEKAESIQFASDNESHGYLLENGLSDFFRNLALCAKRSEVPCEEREGITVEDEQVLSVLTPEAASQLTVVQHTSEWYHKSDTSFLFKELDRIFGVTDRLQHEKDRADQLAWMQNTSIFNDSSAVWNWWPIPKDELFSVDDIKNIVKKLRLSENIHNFELFTSPRCTLPEGMKSYESFTKLLNITLSKYEINNRLRKIHFLSQIYHETDRLRTTSEYASGTAYNPQPGTKYKNGNGPGDGPKYKGRGLMQLTWKDNYQLYKEYSGIDVVTEYEKVSNDLEVSLDSAGWYFKQGKVFSNSEYWSVSSNSPEYIKVYKDFYKKVEVGIEKNRYKTIDLNLIADNDQIDLISYFVNGGSNGLKERRHYCNILKEII